MIRSHHERAVMGQATRMVWCAPTIPLEVRILSVADVYDSLASERPYRPALSHDHCLQILWDDAQGGGLDPELVEIFCKLMVAPPRNGLAASGCDRETGTGRTVPALADARG